MEVPSADWLLLVALRSQQTYVGIDDGGHCILLAKGFDGSTLHSKGRKPSDTDSRIVGIR